MLDEMVWESAVWKKRPTLSWNCSSTNGLSGVTEREESSRPCDTNFWRFASAKVARPLFKLLSLLIISLLLKEWGSRLFSPLDILYFWNKCSIILTSCVYCPADVQPKLSHIGYNCIKPVLCNIHKLYILVQSSHVWRVFRLLILLILLSHWM